MHLKSTDVDRNGPSPRARRCLALAAALCGVLFAASLVIVPPASAEDVTIWSAELEVKTLNAAQDEFGCSHTTPFNGQCANSNVLSDDDFSLHGNPYTITRIEDDGSELELTLDTALPSNVLEFLTLKVGRYRAGLRGRQRQFQALHLVVQPLLVFGRRRGPQHHGRQRAVPGKEHLPG